MTVFLAFDTSERNASAAVFDGTECLSQEDAANWTFRQSPSDSSPKKGSSTTIISLIKEVMTQSSVEPNELSAIAFSNGPGTFTGVRVGIVAARMLCFAWGTPMAVVNSLDVSAAKLAHHDQIRSGARIWSAVNAQRGEVFASAYAVKPDYRTETDTSMSLYSRPEFIEAIQPGDYVTGSGARLFGDAISDKTNLEIPAVEIARCDAAGVATLVHKRIQQGSFDDLHSVKPIYFRPSAAEEVRIANASKSG